MKNIELDKAKFSISQEQEINRNLMNAIPGGVAVFSSYADDTHALLYCNDEVCRISGFTREEIEGGNPFDICKAIDEDAPKISVLIQESILTGKQTKAIYRTKTKAGEIKYIQVSASVVMRDPTTQYTYVIYNDITEQEQQRISVQLQNEKMRRIVNTVPGGVFRCKNEPGWQVLDANDGFYRFIGYTKEEFSAQFHNSIARLVPVDDIEEIVKVMKERLSVGNRIKTQNRLICKNGVVKWIDIQAERSVDQSGNEYLYCIFVDITERAELKQQLKLYRTSNLSGVFSVVVDEHFTLLYGNDKYYQMHEYTKESMQERIQNHCAKYVHPDDLGMVKKVIDDTIANGESSAQWVMRVITGNDNIRYTLCSGIFQNEDGRMVMNGVVMDITEQKETEAALRDSEEKVRIATENSDVSFWTYDFSSKTIIATAASKRLHSDVERVENAPDSLIESGYVRHDSVQAFSELYQKLLDGAKTASGDFWVQTVDKCGWWCEHIDYTNVFDDDGTPIYAHGIGKDVTAVKNAERQYQEEVAYAKATQSEKLLVKVRSNITKNVVERYIANNTVGISKDDTPYDVGTEQLAQTGFTEEEREMIRCYLNRERVLQSFAEGETTYSIDYRRKAHDGSVIWVNTTVKSYQNPETGDVMSFMYTYNINEEKIKEGIIEAVTSLEYDFIAYIDLKNNKFALYMSGESFEQLIPNQTENYTQSVYDINRAIVVPEDIERAISDMLPDGIRKNLKSQRVFSTVYSIYDDQKNIRQKRLQYAYLDEASEQVVCTQTDVTDILEEQKQQHDTLEAALLAAEQANSAKSDFLSRMSHEIRTPMNAIIGMTTIAAHSIGDDEQIADCIGKIGISSRFLLSLINDILDMSRIESGKVLLKSEKIPFEEFINQINTICYTQAKTKDIDYECVVDPNLEDYYMGDAMKLQQVVINILSNSVKFTPQKGKVTLNIHQMKKDKSSATVRFLVNDTGCGISEEFIPRIFDAFAQEHSGTTTKYGGTGLGLAICKNLVDMMDGHIGVRSIVGVGTEFTVDVKLGITEESKTRYLNNVQYSFAELKALVVDDDATVCEYAVITLKEMGIQSEWVDSGKKAIDKVREKWENKKYYDLVLVDWKMPEMDGIETARRIRKIVGPDVTIIIMTAYDWASIEREAKRAGVNLLMSKPMFKSNLVSAFEKVLGKQVEKETVVGEDFRFDNKRILLTEDHPQNVEVAKRLLEYKGFSVEHAENGLRALEMFATSTVGYYDAILMDIRMPQMDGLQAANAIRHLSKPNAKTIPIIAMTANAFEEDIQKSKAAGMNAHLTKPIDPRLLYQTLYDFIYGKKGYHDGF